MTSEIGSDDLGVFLDLCRCAFRDLFAEVQHDDTVGNRHDQRHVMFDQQHSNAPLIPRAADQITESHHFLMVQPCGWFIEQDDLWSHGECSRKLDPFARAEGQVVHEPLGVLPKVQPFYDLFDLFPETPLFRERRRQAQRLGQ